jgi:hypothetical protein
MALRGIQRLSSRFGIAHPRLIVSGPDTTPVETPFHLFPTAAPSGTAAAGDVYFDTTTKLWMTSDGTVFSGPMAKRPVKNGAATLTKADSGAVCYFSTAAGYLYTLPTAEVGLHFRFVVLTTITSVGAKVITASASEFLFGGFEQSTDGTYTTAIHAANGTDIRSWTGNGTTTGGLAQDWFEVVAISATQWAIHGHGRATGNEATPFATS